VKPQPLTKKQARALVDSAGQGADGLRNRALLVLMYRAGLRVSEACRQHAADWTPAANGAAVVRVTHPKGEGTWGVHRSIGLDPTAAALVGEWLEIRPANGPAMFPTSSGRPVHPSHIRRLLRSLAAANGLERRVHPHCLRHTFARELYDENKRIREIQLALGHSSLATTETYLISIGATEAVAATIKREKW